MEIIVCLSDENGMMFNNRRQSRDSAVIRDMERYISDKLLTDMYSHTLFEGSTINAVISENPLEAAGSEDYCFIENRSAAPYRDMIKEVIIYRWNRKYPADFYFDLDLNGYKLTEISEFKGSSHEKITKEVWMREKR